MKKKSNLLTSLFLVTVFIIGFAGSAYANNEIAEDSSKVGIDMESLGFLERDRKGNLQITEKYITEVKKNLEKEGIEADILIRGNSIEIIEKDQNVTLNETQHLYAKSGGVTKIQWISKNKFKLYLNNRLCNKIVGGASIGAAISALVPDPVASKIITAGLGTVSGLIQVNNKGRGVIVSGVVNGYHIPNLPPFVFYWIKSQ